MTFKPKTWFPIAVALSLLNVVSVAFPAPVMPWHAATHAILAVAFGLWAQRLRRQLRATEDETPLEANDRVEALEGEVNRLAQELAEVQNRLDFAERLLSQGREAGRVGPQR